MNHDSSSSYTCPMHPEIVRASPGMCPECGMNLVPTGKKQSAMEHGKHDHEDPARSKRRTDKHAGHSTAMFFRKFWVSLALTVPVVLYADVVEKIFGWSAPDFSGSAYLPLVLGSIVFFYGGWVFLAGAWREMQGKLPGMMTLIGIAITAAYLWSVYAVFVGEEALVWELRTLITIMLLGHWLEMRPVSGAQGALKELSKLLPDTAEVIRDGRTETITLAELSVHSLGANPSPSGERFNIDPPLRYTGAYATLPEGRPHALRLQIPSRVDHEVSKADIGR